MAEQRANRADEVATKLEEDGVTTDASDVVEFTRADHNNPVTALDTIELDFVRVWVDAVGADAIWTLEGSDDASGWISINTGTVTSGTSDTVFAGSVAYPHVRLKITSEGHNVRLTQRSSSGGRTADPSTDGALAGVATLDPDTTEQQFDFTSETAAPLPKRDIGGDTYIDVRALSRLTVSIHLTGTQTTGKVYGRQTESHDEYELASVDTSGTSADYGTTYELLDERDIISSVGWVRVTETGAADTTNTIRAALTAA